MELSIAGIIAAVGILFGLNFIGLFLALYVFDRSATHILYYLGAGSAFMLVGFAHLLSALTPYPNAFLALVEISQAMGLALVGLGLNRALSLNLSTRLLWGLVVLTSAFAIILSGRPELDILRLSSVSLCNIFTVVYVVSAILRVSGGSFRLRLLAFLTCGLAVSPAMQVVMAVLIPVLYPAMDSAAQLEAHSRIVNVVYLTTLFGGCAGLMFHVMSDLLSHYRNVAVTDGLTGLLNRRGFLGAANAANGEPLALIMLDIDHFKAINDTWGHDAGDRVIAAVAALMARAAPSPHLCGRLGGEEFAVLLQRTEPATAEAVAQSLRTAIEIELKGFLADDHPVTASLGVAPVYDGNLENALIAADHALYAAKHSGRNAVRLEGVHRRMGGRDADRGTPLRA